MPYANSSGHSLYYEDSTEGSDPLIFVPGFGGIGSFWRSQQEHFSPRNRVLTVDHRGTGSSSKMPSNYSIDQMAEDVIAVLDHAGIAKATIVGHSTGGVIAQTMAARWPTRIDRLILSSTWCKPGSYFRHVFEFRRSLLERGDFAGYHAAGLFFRYRPSDLEKNEDLWTPPDSVDVGITIKRINAVLDSNVSDQARGLLHRTLVLATNDDMLVPRFLSDELAATIPSAEYIVLKEGGHFHPETKSREFNQVVADFLVMRSICAHSPQE